MTSISGYIAVFPVECQLLQDSENVIPVPVRRVMIIDIPYVGLPFPTEDLYFPLTYTSVRDQCELCVGYFPSMIHLRGFINSGMIDNIRRCIEPATLNVGFNGLEASDGGAWIDVVRRKDLTGHPFPVHPSELDVYCGEVHPFKCRAWGGKHRLVLEEYRDTENPVNTGNGEYPNEYILRLLRVN